MLFVDRINWLNPVLRVAKERSTFEVDKNGGIVNNQEKNWGNFNLIDWELRIGIRNWKNVKP